MPTTSTWREFIGRGKGRAAILSAPCTSNFTPPPPTQASLFYAAFSAKQGVAVTSMTSLSRDVIDDVTNRRAVGTFI